MSAFFPVCAIVVSIFCLALAFICISCIALPRHPELDSGSPDAVWYPFL
jgi:hypothetical protein